MARKLHAASGRPPRKDFSRFVMGLPASSYTLALTHVTSGYFLRDIIDEGAISASEPCKVMGEPLIYAFYGRVAFRKSGDDQPSDLPFLFPALLVLDPKKLPNPKYVFGFDSGAFVGGYMDEYMDPYMPLFDFHIEPDIELVSRLISEAFGSADDYLSNSVSTAFRVPQGNFEAVSYSKMISSTGRSSNLLDDRASTPEIVFQSPVPVGDCILAAIMPDVLAADPNIGGRFAALGITVDAYEWSGATRPREYHMLIRRMAKKYTIL